MIDSILDKINFSKYSANFIDVRIEERKSSSVSFKNGELNNISELPKLGAFVRVKQNGEWYYGSTTNLQNITGLIEELVSLSDTKSSLIEKSCKEDRKEIKNLDISLSVYKTLSEKKELVESFLPDLKEERQVVEYTISFRDELEKKWYLNSEGVRRYYDTANAGLSAYYTLADNGKRFTTSFLLEGKRLEDFKNFDTELVKDIEEARQFLTAEQVTPGTYPVILSESVAGVFAHESFGHKSEADFAVADKAALDEWQIGKTVANPVVSIIDEGNIEGTNGYLPFDDEGVEKKKTFLIKNGNLMGRLHSKNTSTILKEDATGNARAVGFDFEPIVRMTNTYIDKGDKTFDELLADIDDGIYVKKCIHGSGLSTFTIAVDRAYKVKNGKLDEPVRVNVITGTIFETLHNIDGLSDEVKLTNSVFAGCGKMEQSGLRVSMGGPKVRVKSMNVT